MASIAPKADKEKKSITIRNSSGKQLFYTAIQPNQEIVQSGVIYNNSDSYTLDNAYPRMLEDIWKSGSAVFSRYINLKKNLIIGNGLQPVEDNNDALWNWIAKKNEAGQDKNDMLECLAFDLSLYEAAYLQIVYDSTNKPADLYFTDFNKIRAGERNDLGFSTDWFYSDNWGIVTNQRQWGKGGARNQAQFKIQNYNPLNVVDGRQLMQIMPYGGGSSYPCVSYNSVIPYIKLAYQLGVFELNRALQGFLPSTIVYVVGISGEKEQQAYVDNFEANFVGVNKSKVLFMFGENTDSSPKVESLEGDQTKGEGIFEKLIEICNQQITIAMAGSMPLSGIEKHGQQLGGGDNQLFLARENYILNNVVPVQELILKKLNAITESLGLGELCIKPVPLRITLAIQDADTLTRTEKREMLFGLDPLPEDEPIQEASGSTTTTLPVDTANVAATALNGAQISSLLEVINTIGVGSMTTESAKAIISVAYPTFTTEQIDGIINNLKPVGQQPIVAPVIPK